ncbi:MAG: AAA family ATPase, partial [Candidatus Rifleibacteriota bacterium]
MKEIRRLAEDRIVKSLQSFPIVYIAGPRQSGKTTLVQNIARTRHKADYITFDDLQTRSAAQKDPETFARSFTGPVVLDEIQMVPELFRVLKVVVDENRKRKDAGKGRFLLTGSANVMALPKLSDALV